MICAVIMAGGKGERFWPLSTDKKPKQFLSILGKETMIQMTVNRLLPLVPIERIFVVTCKMYKDLVKEQLKELPEKNIIIEPVGRNTAPCIALSAFYINKYYEDSTIIVLPSDHQIGDSNEFLNVLVTGCNFVDRKKDAVVTVGMEPDRPETGYGYIKTLKSPLSSIRNNTIYKVEKFVEKPDKEKAEMYLNDGGYLWNGGMFIWKATNILRLTNIYLNNTFNVLSEVAAEDGEYERKLQEKYPEVDNISVDFAIMEKADDIYVVPGKFGWDDVGSWYALERYMDKDEEGNICVGEVKSLDCSNNIIYSNDKPIVVNGLNDVLLIETENMIYICSKNKIDEIKNIKSIVENANH